jgi:simple sugar transport system ATP-binding protein
MDGPPGASYTEQGGSMLTLRGITKSFPGVLANDQVDLDVYGGEVHALLGENGAGKSTLMKVLYGFLRADAGQIRLHGHPVHIRSPHDARQLRIGMVFQTFTLIPALTVAENIALFLPHLPAVLEQARVVARIDEMSRRYGLKVDPAAEVRQLSIGEQQKVEVLKLLLADARVLIFDEPTRVLAPHEIEALFEVFANLRRDGYAVIFITHKLHEVLACADRVTVMRRGRVAATLLRAEATEAGLVSLMFGAAPAELRRTSGAEPAAGAPLLELRAVDTRGQGSATSLHAVDLMIRPGEVVGVAGVSGNGQRELGDVILGLEPCWRGAKLLFGQDATRWSVTRIRRSGVAFIPEDPLGMAMVPTLTVRENLALGNTRRYARHGGLAMDWALVRADLDQTLQRFAMSVPPLEVVAATLSGGNLQRVVIARELARHPRLIIAFYPTRGLDVPSATATRALLLAARNAGAGVLLISEDLAELFSLSDRIVVVYRGRIVGQFRPEQTTAAAVGLLMTGATDAHAAGH